MGQGREVPLTGGVDSAFSVELEGSKMKVGQSSVCVCVCVCVYVHAHAFWLVSELQGPAYLCLPSAEVISAPLCLTSRIWVLGVELRSFYLEGKHLSDLLAEPFLYYRVSISDAPALSLLPLATVTIIPNCGGLNKDDLHGS